MKSVDLILMASGYGKRFGGNKLLAPYRGKKLYQHGMETALESGADRIFMVTQYEEICEEIRSRKLPIFCIWNDHPEYGISQSIKMGLKHCLFSEGCCFMVCDQPELKASTLAQMIEYFRKNPGKILTASDGVRRGNPVIFPRKYFDELMELSGDVGGRRVILKHPSMVEEWIVKNAYELKDIDEEKDLIQ